MDEAAMQTQALPVTLVPLEDEMQLTQGAREETVKETPAPKPTSKPQEIEQAQHIGDGDIDTNAPLNPQEKPREVEVAAANTTPPEREENPAPVKDTPPLPEVKEPEPAPQPEQTAAIEEPKPQEPEEAPPPPAQEQQPVQPPEPPPPAQEPPAQEASIAEPEKKPEEVVASPPPPALPTLPDSAPAPTQKPKMTAKTPENPPQPEKPVQETKPAQRDMPVETASRAPAPASQTDNLEDILAENAALLDRTRTQGGGAKRAEGEAAFGSRTSNNNDNRLAQTISNVIGGCVQRNWRLASISGSSAYDLAVRVHVRFHPDGTIDGEPELSASGGDAAQREIITYQASAALRKCAPFNLPADSYNKWRDVTINMRAFPG